MRLGGFGAEEGPAVCQSGIHLDIWNDVCESVMLTRQGAQNSQQSEQGGQQAVESASAE